MPRQTAVPLDRARESRRPGVSHGSQERRLLLHRWLRRLGTPVGGQSAQVLAVDAEGRCELDDGPALAAETARRLSCDAAVVGIVEGERGTPLDVGRKTRSIPPAIRRALQVRDDGCCFPGCANRRFVDGHHIRHWASGGETSLANLALLCRVHHRAVHEGAYSIEATGDPRHPVRFRRPDGTMLVQQSQAPVTDHRAVVTDNLQRGLTIDHATAVPSWAGERLDLGLCIEALLGPDGRRATG